MAYSTTMRYMRNGARVFPSHLPDVQIKVGRFVLAILLICSPSLGWAQWQSKFLQSDERQSEQLRGQSSDSAATPSQSVVPRGLKTQTQLERAKEWGLTDAEWTRYEEVMAGPRGYWSPHLDPLTALGVEARTDSERRHIAELWVKMETARTTRELAFELEHMNAQKRLYPDVKPIQYSSQPRGKSTLASTGPKRILFFANKDCIDTCRAPIANLIKIASGDRGVVLDVYVKGFESNDQALREWAAKQQIPAQLVQASRITLNHENGALNRLKLLFENLPLTLLRTPDGKLTPFKG